jgi:DNA-3-methyladenine glycosylase I
VAGDVIDGPDGVVRCSWALAAPELLSYHDGEWGRPELTDGGLFEHISLESFQCGLSWLTILRRREGFRSAFAGFSIPEVAAMGADDVERLLADERIIRNRQKIVATISNARAALEVIDELGSLARLFWPFAPPAARAPRSYSDMATRTPESEALARELKRRGFTFFGPTTAYAMMQACGMVNGHLEACHARELAEAGREKALEQLE